MCSEIGPQMAVFVCSEVAGGAAILLAVRDPAIDEVDTGWQFLCGANEHVKAQIWALHEVLELDPSLEPFIEFPVGTTIKRKSAGEQWEVSWEPIDNR